MAPRGSGLPFPPLSAAGGWGGSGGHLSCTTDRIMLVLAIAALVWIGGLVAFVGMGSSGSLNHPTWPHSHKTSLQPRGHIDEAEPTAASGASGSEVQGHARGFGLSKLVELQHELSHELHNMFEHDLEPPTSRYGKHHEAEAAAALTAGTTAVAATAAATATESKVVYRHPNVVVHEKHHGSSSATASVGMTNPAVVVITYTRRHYLLRTLDSLTACPGLSDFSLYVSQDGHQPDLTDLPAKYSGSNLHLLHHTRKWLLSADQSGTAYLAQHYKWLLDKLFLEHGHSHVVIMEDDMVVSPDFLTLFKETAPLLDTDPTLLCVSSWNDNGFSRFVSDPTRLMRTDYFPGLGWMTNRAVWAELSPKFPLDQWDHFMRLDSTYLGRDCLIPEVSRNHNIGEEGTNMGDGFFQKYLAQIALQTTPVSFQKHNARKTVGGIEAVDADAPPDVEHMRSAAYEAHLKAEVAAATLLGHYSEPHVQQLLREALAATQRPAPKEPMNKSGWLVLYDRLHYPALAALLGLLPVPRAAHKGLSSLRLGGGLLYLADVKRCPYISEDFQFKRDPSVRAVVAAQNEACSMACGKLGGRCVQSHFQFLNECSVLSKHFPCVKGCRGGVAGQDVPNYVDNHSKPELYGYCLTTEEESTCDAKHWSASRLCPCKLPESSASAAPPAKPAKV